MKDLYKTPQGFSAKKGDPNYWLDAVRDFWAETGLDTDAIDLQEIVNYFDAVRSSFNAEKSENNQK